MNMSKNRIDFESHVASERTHLSQVRRAFADAVKIEAADPSMVNFLVVCCDYMIFSLRRLIEQDVVLHERLLPHVDSDDAEYQEKLKKLDTGLSSMETFIRNLENAKLQLVKSGLYGLHDFKKVANEFLDAFLTMLASNRHSTYSLEKKVFQSSDWKAIACISEESIQSEKDLYHDVIISSPEGLNPRDYPPIGHQQAVE